MFRYPLPEQIFLREVIGRSGRYDFGTNEAGAEPFATARNRPFEDAAVLGDELVFEK